MIASTSLPAEEASHCRWLLLERYRERAEEETAAIEQQRRDVVQHRLHPSEDRLETDQAQQGFWAGAQHQAGLVALHCTPVVPALSLAYRSASTASRDTGGPEVGPILSPV